MESKIESLRENQVWNLIDPPDGVKTIECKWIYKKKKDMDGNVHIHKARLVAKGFRQVYNGVRSHFSIFLYFLTYFLYLVCSLESHSHPPSLASEKFGIDDVYI